MNVLSSPAPYATVTPPPMRTPTPTALLPLLPLQQAAALASLAHPGQGFEVEQVVWQMPQARSAAELATAWTAAARALPLLRLVPQLTAGGGFTQRLLTDHRPKVLTVDAPADGEALERWLGEDRRLGLALDGEAPPWRVTMLGERLMVFTIHHLLCDGRALERILLHVAGTLLGRPAADGDDAAEFAAALTMRASAVATGIDAAWWRERLAGWTAGDPLPGDPQATAAIAARRVETLLSADETTEIEAAAALHGTSVATLVHAAWTVLLTVWNRSDDVLYANVRACRHSQGHGLGPLAGPFMNPLPRRVRTAPDGTCGELIAQLHRLQQEERGHELATVAGIAAACGLPAARLPVETLVSIDHRTPVAAAAALLGPGHQLELLEKPSFALSLRAVLQPRVALTIYADPRRFSGAATDRFGLQLRHLLLTIARAPGTPLRALPVLDAEQHRRLVVAYNATSMAMPGGLGLHQLFEQRAAACPAAPAVFDGAAVLTFGELDAAANRLAAHLVARGVRPGAMVAVRLDRSAAQTTALLAVLKAGATYVPLDPQWPVERARWILASTRAALLVTDHAHALPAPTDAEGKNTDQVLVDGERERIAARPAERIPLAVDECQPAYVIFTSGSTGTPKGVVIDHRGALNTIHDLNARLGLSADDRVLAISSYTFDLSVYDLFGVLGAGGALVICPPNATRDPQRWADLVRRHRITLWNSVPALAEMLIEGCRGRHGDLASLRLVMMSGDWIPVSLPERMRAALPQADQLSLGGATEASIWSILHPIARLAPEARSVPYGRPMVNQEFHVLDRHLRRCPVLVPGDLHIGGIGLALGYWDDPVRTAAAFITGPDGARLYRTGDQGRFLPAGDIEFLGRLDNQVKLNGFRIELGEIEAVARRHPGVRDSFAMVREDLPGQRLLALYLVCDGTPPSGAAVLAHCRRFLAEYMLPSAIMTVDALPLSSNGKVDRKALPRPGATTAERQPLGPDEEKLAALWERLLGRRPDGPQRTFFECGGDSLAAIRLVDAMRREFTRAPSVQQVFETPALRDLAKTIAAPAALPSSSSMVRLQTGGSRPPLFLIGEYFDVGRFMDPEQPFYGLFLGAGVRVREPHLGFADIARRCLKEIRAVQPEGRLRLGGHCFGAIVAFEIAKQLELQGETVDHLVMLDPPAPPGIAPPPVTAADRLRYHLQRMVATGPLGSVRHAGRSLRNLYGQWQERMNGIHEGRIYQDFIPRKLNAPVTLILASEGYLRSVRSGDPRLAWGNWCASAEFQEASGDHVTFCRAPQVAGLATRLSALLDRPPVETVPAH